MGMKLNMITPEQFADGGSGKAKSILSDKDRFIYRENGQKINVLQWAISLGKFKDDPKEK